MKTPASAQNDPTFAPNDKDQTGLRNLVLFCAGLGALSGISTDIMLPAFGDMAAMLNTPMYRVQATISVFALFFGASQLFYGPFSDQFGRKPAIAVGMSIFLIGAGLSALAFNIETLLLGRALQGVGCGAGPVISRAILRDTHSGIPLARAMATAFAIFGLGPICAPFIGYFLNQHTGWRFIFVAVGIFAALLLMYNFLRYQETLARKDENAMSLQGLKAAILTVLRNKQSVYFIICASASYWALFTFIANAPIIYKSTFGVEGLHFATLFGLSGIGIIIGQTLNRALLPKLGVLMMLKLASLILLVATVGVAVGHWFNILDANLFSVMMFFFNTSFLAVVSNTASLTLDPHPKIAGITSAFFGFVTNLTASVVLLLTTSIVDGDIVRWSMIMVLMTSTAALLIWAPYAKRMLDN